MAGTAGCHPTSIYPFYLHKKKIIFLCGALKCPTKILYFPAFLVPRFGHMTKFWQLRLYVILIRGLIKGSGLF